MLVTFAPSAPSRAQVGGGIAIESDYRLRGFSYSAGRPTATARIGYDDTSGIYANGSATVLLTGDEDLRFLGVQGNLGIAKRIDPLWAVDGGVIHNEFRPAYPGARSYDYTEVYLGMTRDPLSARVYFSPNYFRSGVRTLYGELDGSVTPAKDWRLNAHIGVLTYLSSPEEYSPPNSTYYDWRVGVVRQLGNFEVHASVSDGGPGQQYYRGSRHSRTAVTFGGSWSY